MSVDYNIEGFGFVGAYSKSDRTNEQAGDGYGDNAEVWSLAAKYDAAPNAAVQDELAAMKAKLGLQ